MSTPLVDLLGPELASASGTVKTADALAGKTVGLYFSAHWCPPCRGFTPKLAEFYTKDLKAKNLEIVFVSSDKSAGEFTDYFGTQPWLALPFDKRDVKAKLSKKYKVQGIPSFVILDGTTGATITKDGREAVMDDPTGAKLPWKPPTIWEALGSDFLHGTDGETVDVDEIKGPGKVIGLYFSAHWCPPCKAFTPHLVSAYKDHLKAKKLEIIFVSSDKSPAEFKEYYAEMPWLAIPNGDKRKDTLSSRFGVQGIPTFVLIDGETGETISDNARGKVASDPTGAEFPWFPKALVDMEDGPEGINESPSLCVLMEGCDAAVVAAATKALEPMAEAAKAVAKAGGDEMLFFYASKGGVSDKVRALTKMGSPLGTPQIVLLDIPDDGGYYVSPAQEVTADTVGSFLQSYAAGALDRQQLG